MAGLSFLRRHRAAIHLFWAIDHVGPTAEPAQHFQAAEMFRPTGLIESRYMATDADSLE